MPSTKRKIGIYTKSRNGCEVCKKSKLKCGEEKPRCKRCTKKNLTCDYPLTETWILEAFPQDQRQPISELETSKRLRDAVKPMPTPAHGVVTHVASTPAMYEDDESRGELGKSLFNVQETQANTSLNSGEDPGMSLSVWEAAKTLPVSELLCRNNLSTNSTDQAGETRYTPRGADRCNSPYHSLSPFPPFTGSHEMLALQYYLEIPARSVAFETTRSFFAITLPQVSYVYEPVRCAIVALAGMHASVHTLGHSVSWLRSPIYYYNKSITTLLRSKPNRAQVLLVCSLLWVYDRLVNDHRSAWIHRDSASKILREWRQNEIGMTPAMDRFIASDIEPAFEFGFKVSERTLYCREVLNSLHGIGLSSSEQTLSSISLVSDTLFDCVSHYMLVVEGRRTLSTLLETKLYKGLYAWNQSFDHYSGADWVIGGRLLILYATTASLFSELCCGPVPLLDDHLRSAQLCFLIEDMANLLLESETGYLKSTGDHMRLVGPILMLAGTLPEDKKSAMADYIGVLRARKEFDSTHTSKCSEI